MLCQFSYNPVLQIILHTWFFLWTDHVTAIPNQWQWNACVWCLLVVKESCQCAFYPGKLQGLVSSFPACRSCLHFSVTLQGAVARKGGLCSSRCPALLSPSELTIVYSEIRFNWQPVNVTSGSVFINWEPFQTLEELRLQWTAIYPLPRFTC